MLCFVHDLANRQRGLAAWPGRHRLLASDYIMAAVSAGFNVLDCAEPRWGLVQGKGGGLAGSWCPAAAAAAYRDTPAVIAWHLERR